MAAIAMSLTARLGARGGHALGGSLTRLRLGDAGRPPGCAPDSGLGAPASPAASACASLLSDSFRGFNHNSAGLIDDRYEKQLLPARRAGFFI